MTNHLDATFYFDGRNQCAPTAASAALIWVAPSSRFRHLHYLCHSSCCCYANEASFHQPLPISPVDAVRHFRFPSPNDSLILPALHLTFTPFPLPPPLRVFYFCNTQLTFLSFESFKLTPIFVEPTNWKLLLYVRQFLVRFQYFDEIYIRPSWASCERALHRVCMTTAL